MVGASHKDGVKMGEVEAVVQMLTRTAKAFLRSGHCQALQKSVLKQKVTWTAQGAEGGVCRGPGTWRRELRGPGDRSCMSL